MKNKIAILVGTRPEAIKLLPVYFALKEINSVEPVLISTGQHKEMLDAVFDVFGQQPDIRLNVMTADQSLSELTSRILMALSPVIQSGDYRQLVVQGDTATAFSGALVGHYQKVVVAHVEAGLRTYDKWAPFPEETNRRMIGAIADYHFAATKQAAEALFRENVTKNVHVVGNTVVDALLYMKARVLEREHEYAATFDDVPCQGSKYILVTGHRRESFGSGIENICVALEQIASRHQDLKIIYAVHLNPNIRHVVRNKLRRVSNVVLLDPLPYDRMVFLMARAWLILTDSGGIQEEAPSLNVPLLVMREKTERPEGIAAGCAKLVGTNPKLIVESVEMLIDDDAHYKAMSRVENPYGDGHAASRIAGILSKSFREGASTSISGSFT